MSDRNNFHGKVVLVTGSSSGIGECIAVHFASLGAKVVVTGRDKDRLQLVEQKCKSLSSPDDVLSVVADVTNQDDLKHLISETIGHFGRLDVLVNNAGYYQLINFSHDDYMEVYDRSMNINLRSVVLLTKLAMPHLVESKGNVVNVSSVASQKSGPYRSVYNMTKASCDMFTKCLASEYGPKGVRVNSINPAAIRTPLFDKLEYFETSTDEVNNIFSQIYSLRRIGEPIDCAKAVAYLASADADFVSGVNLFIDGGGNNTVGTDNPYNN